MQQTLKDWFANKLELLKAKNAKLNDIMILRSFYYLMSAEYGIYSIQDWNEKFREFINKNTKHEQ